jgi:hypothetical protein
VAKKSESVKAGVARHLNQFRDSAFDVENFEALRREFPDSSESYLRKLVRELAETNSIKLSPLVEGVRQNSFEALERTLLALAAEYERAESDVRRELRELVIDAKDHAKFSMRSAEAARVASKQEMLLWMLTWLDNPSLFPTWLALRKQAATESR